MMEFLPLDRTEFQDHPIRVRYETDRLFQVDLLDRGFALRETILETPVTKTWEDTLFGEWLEAPVTFGAYKQGCLLGVVEGSVESWHRLFRISNLFVEPGYRGQGVGTFLLRNMMAWAEAHTDCRGMILETQTCNYPAICLYEKLGFRLSRIDTHEYTNDDVAHGEVRIDLFCPVLRNNT